MGSKKTNFRFEINQRYQVPVVLCSVCNGPVTGTAELKRKIRLSCQACNINEIWSLWRYRKRIAKLTENLALKKAEEPKPEPQDSGIIVRDGFAVPASANPTFTHSNYPPGYEAKTKADDLAPTESKTGQGYLEDNIIKKWKEYRQREDPRCESAIIF